MRAWTAVVLVDLALLFAALGGWAAWQRSQASAALAAQTVTFGGPEQEWHDVPGVVRALLPDLGIVVLTHADIPGYMPGMTMGFKLADVEIPDTLSVGDAVRFDLRGSPPLVAITALEKVP
ncbi:MAG TPA: copper-binding protein [Terriglobales bacterium]|nr:copper-binding protein [Terriglobales bacterium]